MGFSPDYTSARKRFVETAESQGGSVEAFMHPLKGPDGDDLSMDLAWFGNRASPNVIVTMSGVHGVEGFFGSAVQIAWMERGEHQRLKKNTAALMIHAVNPYGFAWLRRGDENNVDLNRNWIDFDSPLPKNAQYDKLHPDLCPEDWSSDTQERTTQRLAAWMAELTFEGYKAALTFGQWRHSDGLFYSGSEPTWSRKKLTSIVGEYLASAQRVAILDFHTGLGPHGYVEPIIHRRPNDPGFRRTRAWVGAAATSLYDGAISSEVHGDSLSGMRSLMEGVFVDPVSMECGVVPVGLVQQALRSDNWLHAHGDPKSPAGNEIKKAIRSAFHSDALEWQGMALGQGLAMLRNASARVGSR